MQIMGAGRGKAWGRQTTIKSIKGNRSHKQDAWGTQEAYRQPRVLIAQVAYLWFRETEGFAEGPW